jgi:hypothetical protein
MWIEPRRTTVATRFKVSERKVEAYTTIAASESGDNNIVYCIVILDYLETTLSPIASKLPFSRAL